MKTPQEKKSDKQEKITQEIAQKANEKQSIASDPIKSVWVNASAGTGKTKVLTDRVLRLFIPTPNREATAPERILCITFTKAAAAEMANRIQETLSEWTECDDHQLTDYLAKLTGKRPDKNTLRYTRQLFARVVDVPGGMKIMTIHAFCQSVLKRFPLEAGLRPDFKVCEEHQAEQLLKQAMNNVLKLSFQLNEKNFFTDSIAYLSGFLNEDQFKELMKSFIHDRQRFSRFLKNSKTLDTAVKKIYESMGVEEEKTEQVFLREFIQSIDIKAWQSVLDLLDRGNKTEQKNAVKWQSVLEKLKGEVDKVKIEDLEDLFLTVKKTPLALILGKKTQAAYPIESSVVAEWQERFLLFYDQMKSLRVAKATSSFITIGSVVMDRYHGLKRQKGLVDYDDLIDYTKELLSNRDQKDWVLYKLDGGIDHILLDEAQDTSPEQWSMIQSLTQEFFSGLGKQEEKERTLFVVGDEKQSIYSFLKADPYEFIRMRDYFEEKIIQSKNKFEKVSLQTSFRSTRSVLEFVDHIFSLKVNKQGVSLDEEEAIEHKVFRENQPGHVEIWPLAISEKTQERSPWDIPYEREDDISAHKIVATQMAKEIRGWLDDQEFLESKQRFIEPKDIMILLRTRSNFMNLIVQIFKAHDIPISGADRLNLLDDIGVQDLLALASFVLLPSDDLKLASVLKSPLMGLDDDDLIALTKDSRKNIWNNLQEMDEYREIADYLKQWLRENKEIRPYEFFSSVLYSPCPTNTVSGKKALISRLGRECIDPLSELLQVAFKYEQDYFPVLQSFISWVEKEDLEIKRESEVGQANLVRLMTVHGAKGLQAPIVFLPDATTYTSTKDDKLFWVQQNNLLIPAWSPLAEMNNSAIDFLKQQHHARLDEEYRRLLYVALTRAEDRLYVLGKKGKEKSQNDKSWYQIIQRSIESYPLVEQSQEKFDPSHFERTYATVLRHYQDKPHTTKENKNELELFISVPSFLIEPAKAEDETKKPLSPSLQKVDQARILSPLLRDKQQTRFARGLIIHKILQFLPDTEKEQRGKVCREFLKRNYPNIDGKQITEEILTILNNADFELVFSAHSQAEVSLTGVVSMKNKGKHEKIVVSGQIDRLVVLEDKVLIVDYKTNRPSAHTLDDVEKGYWKQMALYRALLSQIMPDKKIECALLWTEKPELMVLPSKRLDDFF